MGVKKLKMDFSEIAKGMSDAMEKDAQASRKAPKAHRIEKREYVEDVDPKQADRHLED